MLLTINPDAPSEIEYVQSDLVGFPKLRKTIIELRLQNEIKSELLYQILNALATIGEETDLKEEQMVIVKIMKRVITSHHLKKNLTNVAKDELLTQLKSLQAELRPQLTPKPSPTPKPSEKNDRR